MPRRQRLRPVQLQNVTLPRNDLDRSVAATSVLSKFSNKNLLELDPSRDFAGHAAVRRRYCILSSPRSGSTLLSRMLFQTGFAGDPQEYFNSKLLRAERHRLESPELELPEFLSRMEQRRTSPNGVFGIKLHYEQALPVFGNQPPFERLLAFLSQHQHLIWIRRRNRLRQAISEAMALKTNIWSSEENRFRPDTPTPSPYECVSALNRVCRNDAGWESLISENRLSTFVIWYEDLVESYEYWARRVIEYLEIGTEVGNIPQPAISRQQYASGEALYRDLKTYLGLR